MVVSTPIPFERSSATIGSREMNFAWCAFGIMTCFRIWRACSPVWRSNWIEPLTRRLARARRHPLPQGERERKGRSRDEPSRHTFPKARRYYIVLQWAVIAAAVAIALKLIGAF